MNFFGHAAVASWSGAPPAVALGAMLPDLAAMAGARPLRIARADVERGVALHHATDAAFHGLPAFASLCGDTCAALRARGLGRGPARGAAHVGVELALDGFLLRDEAAAALYLRALGDRDAAAAIEWDRDAEAFWALIATLARRGLPERYREAAPLARSVERALSRRPRLALTAPGVAIVEAEMPALRARVESAAPSLLRELRRALPSR